MKPAPDQPQNTESPPAVGERGFWSRKSDWHLFRELIDRRWVVLILLFGATAALGLPLLWISRGFPLWQKLFWTVILVFYTAAIVAVTWWLCWLALRELRAVM